MKGPIKPIRNETKKVVDKINELLTNEAKNGRIIIAEESDLRRLIANVIVEMDANYVRKSDLKREIQLALQEIVKSGISTGGK